MPPRARHLPSNAERNALQRLRPGAELTLRELAPTGHRTILTMIAKGWIERGSEGRTYRITVAGKTAMRLKIP
jgi:hypothetical protein